MLPNNSLACACGKQRFVVAIHKQKRFSIASFLFFIYLLCPLLITWELLIVIPFTIVLIRPNAIMLLCFIDVWIVLLLGLHVVL